MGLNDHFRQVKSHILSLETLQKLNKAYAMESHEETQQQMQAPQKITSALAYYNTSKASTSKATQPYTTSTHAGKNIETSRPTTQPSKKGLLHPLRHFLQKWKASQHKLLLFYLCNVWAQ